jgi:Arc/MetJ-type ribon-helix-helix transcriptional regulator
MDVSFKPEIQRFIDNQVKLGHYPSPDDVLEEALARMMEEEASQLDEATLAALDTSEDQIERGQYREWREVSAELRAKHLGK